MTSVWNSKSEIWRQLSDEISGDFVEDASRETMKIATHYQNWTITLDAFRELMGESFQTYTRMRAPYVNKYGFRFTIYRKGFLSRLGQLLGMHDVEIGEPDFDSAFVIKGNDEFALQLLLSNQNIRRLVEQQPQIYLSVWHEELRWFQSRLPEGVDELYFRVPGVITDVERLKSLYDLFAEILNQLCHIGCAYKSNPGIAL